MMLVNGQNIRKQLKIIMNKNLFNLNKKIVYVLGGSGLIGLKISELLSNHNAKVINLDLNQKKIKNFHDNEVLFEKFDCTDFNNSEKRISKIFKKHGYPEVFINSSYPKTKNWNSNSFERLHYTTLRKNLEIHLNSSVWITKIVAEIMKSKNIKGSIIQTGSIYGLVGQDNSIYKNTKMTENISYSVIKGGIINFTRLAASCYGKYGIRINTVCPGGVEDGKQEKIFLKNYKKRVPLGRLAKPKEISSVYLFLSSEGASYITGSSIVVDGGWTCI